MKNKLATIFAITCLLLLPLSSASAHGDLTTTSPAQDETLVEMPAQVSIDFNGQLQTLGKSDINQITVTDSTGQVISDGSSLVEGSKLSTNILLLDSRGLMSVHYRIVSEDGHPVEGDYSFTVGQVPMLISAVEEESSEADGGTEESKSLSFAAIFAILFAAASSFAIIRRIKKK
jgi:methionine-rich copper-binding protein CopC